MNAVNQIDRQAPLSTDETRRKVIGLDSLTKDFGSVRAVDNVTFDVFAGEFVGIMGPSGSGKTTLLNILSLLDVPTGGSYRLDGVETARLTEAEQVVIRREKIGLVFQQFHLIPYLTAVENLMLAQYYHSMADRGEAMEALDRIGLADRADHLPSQLSGGEQQRVCIARALINDPALILADEPTGNLDEGNEERVMGLFKELQAGGRTIILVTHNPDLGAQTDYVIRLQHGRRVA
ncbi:putative ABC transport system ATP-binding protein [Pseudochelatococcus lubricantis]|uniref:ABC transport system ATP-binding protein n=1 Tax=Pseudochelatococcus lubricantis TaxID=1538102 RepID=A0ABX0V1C7_9HYPH|nr:ABC transporter ATP-binding protein [Pseudochelatococcus lubricantis]NIJ59012.1 putative ABC transport system ATP-binding protein [Pseudochelatococcus lubricantis]